MTPRLSVLTTCHNDGATLGQSVRSILDHAGDEVEVLVLSNASTDDTLRVIGRLAEDPRIVSPGIMVTPNPLSHPAAINLLAQEARGDWLLVHNADDWADPGYVAAILAAADANPDVNCIFSPWQWEATRHDVYVFPAYEPHTMLTVHQIPGIRAVRRDFWELLGGEDESLPIGADWDWAVRASLVGLKPLQLDRPYVHVRAQGDGTRLTDQWLQHREHVRAHMRAHRQAAPC